MHNLNCFVISCFMKKSMFEIYLSFLWWIPKLEIKEASFSCLSSLKVHSLLFTYFGLPHPGGEKGYKLSFLILNFHIRLFDHDPHEKQHYESVRMKGRSITFAFRSFYAEVSLCHFGSKTKSQSFLYDYYCALDDMRRACGPAIRSTKIES